ncbi:MAG: hypothetical protein JW727_02520 [Candidatus Aenigmarchaeota archaeon]|nr:hypothetical protein [Candidatus Aenigmarchaeota archaeon]
MAEFGKIQKIIDEKKIGPGESDYHTQRGLENGGKIRVLLLKGEKEAHVEYICPYCGFYEYTKKPFKRPFSVKCAGCDRQVRVQRLKYLADKARKAAEGQIEEE